MNRLRGFISAGFTSSRFHIQPVSRPAGLRLIRFRLTGFQISKLARQPRSATRQVGVQMRPVLIGFERELLYISQYFID